MKQAFNFWVLKSECFGGLLAIGNLSGLNADSSFELSYDSTPYGSFRFLPSLKLSHSYEYFSSQIYLSRNSTFV